MTSDATPPPPPPDPSGGGGSGGKKGGIDFSSLSQAEKLLGLGALAVIAVYVIFFLITEDYSFSSIALLLAFYLAGAILVKLTRPAAVWHVPYAAQLRVVAYLLVLTGVLEFISDLKFDTFDAGGGTLAGALILYAGCAIAGFGAKQLD